MELSIHQVKSIKTSLEKFKKNKQTGQFYVRELEITTNEGTNHTTLLSLYSDKRANLRLK